MSENFLEPPEVRLLVMLHFTPATPLLLTPVVYSSSTYLQVRTYSYKWVNFYDRGLPVYIPSQGDKDFSVFQYT